MTLPAGVCLWVSGPDCCFLRAQGPLAPPWRVFRSHSESPLPTQPTPSIRTLQSSVWLSFWGLSLGSCQLNVTVPWTGHVGHCPPAGSLQNSRLRAWALLGQPARQVLRLTARLAPLPAPTPASHAALAAFEISFYIPFPNHSALLGTSKALVYSFHSN